MNLKSFMKSGALVLAVAVCAGNASAAQGGGESSATSLSIGSAKEVTLVTPSDEGEAEDGVHYLKSTLKRGSAYTVWFEGGDAAKIGLRGMTIYPHEEPFDPGSTDWDDSTDWDAGSFDAGSSSVGSIKEPPMAQFDESGVQTYGKADDRYTFWMSADAWASDDPTSWAYYLRLAGTNGWKTAVHIKLSEKGDRNRADEFAFDEGAEKSRSGWLLESGYRYFQVDLKAGRQYFIRTTGGTAEAPLNLTVEFAVGAYAAVPDSARAEANNTALVVYPESSGTYLFSVSTDKPGSVPFGLAYSVTPARPIAEHPLLLEVTNRSASVTFQPGRVVATNEFYDNIVDEHLVSVSVKAGERWKLSTHGASTNTELRIYNADGTLLESHDALVPGTFDMGYGFDATYDGIYYVGLCDPSLSTTDAVTCAATTLEVRKVSVADGGPTAIVPNAVWTNNFDATAFASVSRTNELGSSCWSQSFDFTGQKNLKYAFATKFTDAVTNLHLKAELFRVSGSSESKVRLDSDDITPGSQVSFTASANGEYRLKVSVAEGKSLAFPAFDLYAVCADFKKGQKLGPLTVRMKPGDDGKWSLDKDTTKYSGSETTILVPVGKHTVKFKAISGLNKPADAECDVKEAGCEPVVGIYLDKTDPDDNESSGATKMPSSQKHTLWTDDPADWFKLTASGAAGVREAIYFSKLAGDARFTIYKDDTSTPVSEETKDLTEWKGQLEKGTYYICVSHADKENPADGTYTIAYASADVGEAVFAKTAVKAKKSAASVKVQVKRTTKTGSARIRYATVAGSAKPGVDYVAQTGVLMWANGENAAQTIEIALIPDLIAVKGGEEKTFSVKLIPLEESELGKGEFQMGADEEPCTVTLSPAGKYKDEADAYKKTTGKTATVKTEDVPLNSGTFCGVLAEEGAELTNGLAKIVSVTLTAKDGGAVSASVVVGGKKYAFKGEGNWTAVGTNGLQQTTLTLDKVNGTLTATLQGGRTTDDGAWLNAGGIVELEMDVPDPKGKGSQAGIRYSGEVYRQNSKIQGYLDNAAKFYGYYTLALAPEDVTSASGIPSGNGYLTVKVDAKGKAKVAGMLADGTKVSVSVKAAAIVSDENTNSVLGCAMLLPVYQAKKTYCFGGTLRLFAQPGKTAADPNKANHQIVVDATEALVWNNDDAAATYDGEEGWRITCAPVGGWYDTVVNLQRFYLNYAFEVGTADITEFPSELVTEGYKIVTDIEPNGLAVGFAGDKIAVPKRALVKSEDKTYVLDESVNPCDVKIKFKRASGVVSGTFSVWSATADGASQREIKGFKHNGVLLHFRDDFAAFDEEVMSAGFFTQKVTLEEEKLVKGKVKTVKRKWTFSAPFNLLGIDQGEPDWWADDAGWNPDWGAEPGK